VIAPRCVAELKPANPPAIAPRCVAEFDLKLKVLSARFFFGGFDASRAPCLRAFACGHPSYVASEACTALKAECCLTEPWPEGEPFR